MRCLKLFLLCLHVSTLALAQKQGLKHKRIVVLTFDDAEINHYTHVAPLLKKYDFTATFFVCEFPVKRTSDTAYYMNWNQIKQLHEMGFEIGNHTGHHKNLTKITAEEIKEEISYIETKCKQFNILKPVSFAYPGNRADTLCQSILKDMDYKYARIGGSQYYNPKQNHPLLIPSYTLASIDKLMNRTFKALKELKVGEIMVFTIHGVPDILHPNYSTTIRDLEKYLQYMKRNKIKVIAMRDLEI